MSDAVVLTFAELAFLLRSGVAAADAVRLRLHLGPESATDVAAAAGVSSLLARGLCTQEGTEVRPGNLAVGVVAALSTVHTITDATTQIGGRPVVLHIFTGERARLIAAPGFMGQYSIEVRPAAEPLAGLLDDLVTRAAEAGGEVAVVLRSTDPAGEERVSLAAARDALGDWYLSDTERSPDRGRPVPRAEVARRIGQLFGDAPVGAGRR
ncbi:hypothetical protein Dvina_31095 [Dactylosporangium vinaceum]|uniref:Uncharacterized protein n=1 Tax=Dactylosporangium vinaceum TaxID=53362 RepID=A0ABV5MK26_9ACTN|nr:hypothetical protein [Dactylosporangium vinaceum]UAB92764.1 hypothetical protein Dvina_31095 [Dactylosporangium vinaceum]